MPMMEHVLVPLSGTESSESVLPYLRRLIRLGVSNVTLLRTELPTTVDEYALLSDTTLDHARGYLQDVTNRLSGMDVHLRALARIGAAADTILDVAREEAVSLILLSTRR